MTKATPEGKRVFQFRLSDEHLAKLAALSAYFGVGRSAYLRKLIDSQYRKKVERLKTNKQEGNEND